jgi:hypothetical protein
MVLRGCGVGRTVAHYVYEERHRGSEVDGQVHRREQYWDFLSSD